MYMKKYFTEHITISAPPLQDLSESISIPYPTNIIVPDIVNYKFEEKGIPAAFTGKDIIKRLFRVSEDLFTIPSINTNLWYIDENQWEQITDVKDIFFCVHSAK